MVDEKLQFAISQYVDGSLAPAEAALMEVRFASDAESRRLLEEYQRLDVLVKGAIPVPVMDWEALARRISAAVDESAGDTRLTMPLAPGAAWWRPVALAAGILICATFAAVAWQTSLRRPVQVVGNVVQPPSRPQGYATVSVFHVGEPISSGEVQVQIAQQAQSGNLMLQGMADAYPGLTSVAHAKVLIAAVPMAASDEDYMFMH